MTIRGTFGEQPLEEKSLLDSLNRIWLPQLKKMLQAINGASASTTFDQSAIASSTTLSFAHGLGSSIISASLIDNTGKLRYDVLAAATLSVVDDDTVELDLSSVAPISGSWTLLIRRD